MVNIVERIKTFIQGIIYSLLIGPILNLIFLMWSILKYLKNISVRIYWLLITAIMQLSLIIVFCGILIITLLIPIGLTIKYKTQSGIVKVRTGLRKILTICSMR